MELWHGNWPRQCPAPRMGVAVVKHVDCVQPSLRECSQTDALLGEVLSGWSIGPENMTPQVWSGAGGLLAAE